MNRFKKGLAVFAVLALAGAMGAFAAGCSKSEPAPEPEPEAPAIDFEAMELEFLPVLMDYQAVEAGQMAPADSKYVPEAYAKGLEQFDRDTVYTFVDIANDGVPEMLIGFNGLELEESYTPTSYRLYGIYALAEAPEFVAPDGMGDTYDAYLREGGVIHLTGMEEDGSYFQRITKLEPNAVTITYVEGVDQSDKLYYTEEGAKDAREIDESEGDQIWGRWDSTYPVIDGSAWEWRVLKDFAWEPTEGAPVEEENEYYSIDLSGELEGATATYDGAWHDQGEGDIGIGHSTDVFSADGEYLFSVACYTGGWTPEGIIVSEELGTFTDNEGREVTAYIFKSTDEDDAAVERDHAKLLEYKEHVSFG